MYNAGSGDDLVRRVAREVKARRLSAHIEVERPHMQCTKRPDELRCVEVDVDPVKLNELRKLPETIAEMLH